ncbi:MAG: S8 family serine peptidase [Caulobacter sp.]|nr:S8 family serine peptidase [Caulobacter sp.]
MTRAPIALLMSMLLALAGTGAARAQLLPSPSSVLRGLPAPLPETPLGEAAREPATSVEPLIDRLSKAGQDLSPGRLVPEALEAARLDRLRARVAQDPRALDRDDLGQPVVRGQVLAVSPSSQALAQAKAEGFKVERRMASGPLGLELVTLAPPRGMDVRAAVARLRALDAAGDYDFNHLYAGAGGAGAGAAPAASGPAARAGRVGLLDGGVSAGERAFAGVKLTRRGFAPGGGAPSAHGTAVASLLAGGGAREILAADVYGSGPAGGSAEAIVGALSWMAQARVPVVNISLVGPANGALGAAVRALVGRGVLVVAAVGNDGPAAPPLYPASYPGVIAVTGVDRQRRLLPEAGRALHVDFAAYGSEVRVAAPGGGGASVRGTSYAAPVVAARLAALAPAPDPATAVRAVARLAQAAVDLGPPGPDTQFGKGLVEAGR